MRWPGDLVDRAEAAWRDGKPWAGLAGDALALAIARVFRETGALVVVDEPDQAEMLIRALRFFADGTVGVLGFPADDVRPYDGFSPSAEVVGQRMRARDRVARGKPVILVAPVRALMQRISARSTWEASTLNLAPGQEQDRDEAIGALIRSGYLMAARVTRPGLLAARGDVVDVWGIGRARPVRIDWFDDEVERVRDLDPSTGRAGRKRARTRLLPARDEVLHPDAIRHFARWTQPRAAGRGPASTLRRRMLEELREGIRPAALEDWLPALSPVEGPLEVLEGLPRVVVHPQSVAASAREVLRQATQRFEALADDERPLVGVEERWIDAASIQEGLRGAHEVFELAGSGASVAMGASALSGLAVRGGDLGPAARKLSAWAGERTRVALVVRDARRATAIEDLLAEHHLRLKGRASLADVRPGEVSLLVGDLPRGFAAPDAGWVVVPVAALFGQVTAAARRAHELFDTAVSDVQDLKPGDPVVHRLHGVGRFEGLVRLQLGGALQDAAKVLYRGDDVLYVPVTALDQLGRYTASVDAGDVKLDRLGGQTWARRKGKVRDALLQSAQALLETQARRELASRDPYPAPGPMYRSFVASFPFTETPDQARAILDVEEDLAGDTPMDRLICGDVGFGKTEVAMRAMVRAVEMGRQVAVLCPTTVLAFQHYLTFQERLEELPIRVGMLSRFTSAADAATLKEGLASGAVDVVVGTHALLGRGVRYRELGLVVIDEEHRFGVRQKERLKRLRAEVDVLSMSATPIPRTLQMALSGARPMSIITTPPGTRLETRTSVARFTEARVRDAILSEVERGGQVFFVHNRIESIDGVADKLASWLPDVRMRVAHGRMSSDRLESLYLDFVKKKFDVLISTSIIETGVDLPNVNTMLVHRADRFGLAQLHQLRGRVGRGTQRGTCLLLVPDEVSSDARRRLQVLVENTRLGAGFAIASADLELRGGGNLLGEAQSGAIEQVGYSVWVELLEEAIHEAQGAQERARIEPEVEVPVDAFLPDDLIPDMTRRMGWYRRIGGARTEAEVDRSLEELEAEVGAGLPQEVHHLAGRVRTVILARELGLASVRWLRVRVDLEVHPASRLSAEVLERFRAAHPKRVSVRAATSSEPARIGVRFTPREEERPFLFLRWLLDRLQRSLSE